MVKNGLGYILGNFLTSASSGWLDWANFRPIGECFILDYFLKINKSSPLFPQLSLCIYIGKKWVWLHFWRFFHKRIRGQFYDRKLCTYNASVLNFYNYAFLQKNSFTLKNAVA
jgi:hypothetical protein